MAQKKSDNARRILTASAIIDGVERGSIEQYFEIGDAYFDGVDAEEWTADQSCADVVGISKSRVQRGRVIRSSFATVVEAQRSFDKAWGMTLTAWIASLDGNKGRGGRTAETLTRSQQQAANRLFAHPDFLALPAATQKKMKKAAGL